MYYIDTSNLSEGACKFVKSILEATFTANYSFSDGMLPTRIYDETIKLPITHSGSPDWEYMETYMRKIEEKAKLSFEKLKTMGKKKKIDVSEWGEFKVGELFKLERGKCSKTTGLNDGNVPYVGCTNVNNGVMAFYDVETETISKGHCICFIGNGNGSAGQQIYREDDFLCSTGNVCGYRENLTPNIAHFIVSVMDSQQKATNKFSHANGRTLEKLSQQVIKLPITSSGEPDWEYMENYIKTVEIKASQTLDHLVNRLEVKSL